MNQVEPKYGEKTHKEVECGCSGSVSSFPTGYETSVNAIYKEPFPSCPSPSHFPDYYRLSSSRGYSRVFGHSHSPQTSAPTKYESIETKSIMLTLATWPKS